jgi:hypothetical protein
VAGGGLTLALVLGLGLAAVIDFDWLFLRFHLLSFSNDYWSSSGYMPLLFPADFWYDMARFTGLIVGGLGLVLGGLGFGWLRFSRRHLASRGS